MDTRSEHVRRSLKKKNRIVYFDWHILREIGTYRENMNETLLNEIRNRPRT